MIERRKTHANLEAHEKCAYDDLVDKMRVDLKESDVVDGKCDEQKQPEYMRPYVDLILDTKILIAAYKIHRDCLQFR